MPVDDPDLTLVQAAQAGDGHAFGQLMERHRQRIFHFIWRHLSDETDAVELAQETFVRAYFSLGTFSPKARFTTWLHQIALNLCRDHVRSKSWRNRQKTDSLSPAPWVAETPVEKELRDPRPDAGSSLEKDEELAHLQQAIDRLPLELKGPLVLTAVDGLSHAEAGEKLGLTAKAVEVKVYRARKKLAQLLGEGGPTAH